MVNEVDPKNIVGSIIKGARLLELFSMEHRELSLRELTTGSGYNKTTTYRLLQTLVSVGWLMRTERGSYRLGSQLLVLGAIARTGLDLRNEALPFMQQLADKLGDTAFLMVPGQQGAVTIETVVGANPVQVHGLTVGSVLPYHVAAGPVVLAAFSSELGELAVGQGLRRFTDNTVCDVEEFAHRLTRVREEGYALSMEDFIDGVGAVGAPILDSDGAPVASLSVGGPTSRFTDGLRDHTIDLVMGAAAALSTRL